jgi:hypothetical protein
VPTHPDRSASRASVAAGTGMGDGTGGSA